MVGKSEVERHEVGIYDEEVGEVFLDSAYDFVVVCFGEALQRGLFDYITEVDVVFPVLGLSQLFDKVLDRLGRRSHKAEAAKMAHLLPLWVVEAVGKVDFMVEEGGLRRRSGYYGDSLVVEEEDLHLGRGGACRSAVPDRHHLGDVAGDGLYDVHGREGISRNLLRA